MSSRLVGASIWSAHPAAACMLKCIHGLLCASRSYGARICVFHGCRVEPAAAIWRPAHRDMLRWTRSERQLQICLKRHKLDKRPTLDVYRKPLKWVASSKRDLDAMPDAVKDVFGHAIDLAQAGHHHPDSKPLAGFGSAAVVEVVADDRDGTYRAVYTVKFPGVVYVLHCFQKKSTAGKRTPAPAMALIRTRLMAAATDYEMNRKGH